MVRTAVLVSGGGTNLEALLKAGEEGKLPSASIVLVVSDRPCYALERAARHGVEGVELSRKRKSFQSELESVLEERGIELIVLAGFLSILPASFTDRYRDRIINIHPSLIPSFCGKGYYGLKVHEEALKRGVKVTGATVHIVNEVPDGGRILLQKAVPVKDGDDAETLQRRVMEEAEWQILPQALEMVANEIVNGRMR